MTTITKTETLEFSEDWNWKLHAKNYFSTIRLHNPKKYAVGNHLQVTCSRPKMDFLARVEKTEEYLLDSIPDSILSLDTGYHAAEARKLFTKFYPDKDWAEQKLSVVLLRKVDAIESDNLFDFAKLNAPKAAEAPVKELPMHKKNALNAIKNLSEKKIAFLDTETTGLEGEAIELSIIDLDGNTLFDSLIQPVLKIYDDMALKTHKILPEEFEKMQTLDYHKEKLVEIFENYTLVIYNKDFDLKILGNNCLRLSGNSADEDVTFAARELLDSIAKSAESAFCLMRNFAEYAGDPNPKYPKSYKWHSLVNACNKMNINTDGIIAHRAIGDCEMTRRLLLKLMEEAKGI